MHMTMRNAITGAVLSLLLGAHAVEAQVRAPGPRTWGVVYGQMYTNIAGFHDPGTVSDWAFDDNVFGLGVAAQREAVPGLVLGADFSLARTDYERRIAGTRTVLPGATGTATIATAMATGRIAYGGAGVLGFYLNGGIGTIAYHLEDVGEWNADFALRAGTGLEYRMAPARALFFEWGRIWGYHEREEIGGGAQQHSVLRLGARFGL
jgi:hypothetical protein